MVMLAIAPSISYQVTSLGDRSIPHSERNKILADPISTSTEAAAKVMLSRALGTNGRVVHLVLQQIAAA
ncbi:hypothetical protein [Microseira wollei]|uniref:hypothetical protein n=1 Tax=Microseira wollei TaxID=467598 RepID=UPI001CFF4EF8|nr:hypothetical protein [Microseira wollei]